MNSQQLPPIAAEYLRSINDQLPNDFAALFVEDAVVQDAGREYRGLPAIRKWGDTDIYQPRVALHPLEVAARGDGVKLTTRVEGNFDRTGLPDPVIIQHSLTLRGDRIAKLVCELAPA